MSRSPDSIPDGHGATAPAEGLDQVPDRWGSTRVLSRPGETMGRGLSYQQDAAREAWPVPFPHVGQIPTGGGV